VKPKSRGEEAAAKARGAQSSLSARQAPLNLTLTPSNSNRKVESFYAEVSDSPIVVTGAPTPSYSTARNRTNALPVAESPVCVSFSFFVFAAVVR
jgi:hypothetical protein